MILSRNIYDKDGKQIIQRMVCYNISKRDKLQKTFTMRQFMMKIQWFVFVILAYRRKCSESLILKNFENKQ